MDWNASESDVEMTPLTAFQSYPSTVTLRIAPAPSNEGTSTWEFESIRTEPHDPETLWSTGMWT
jgi:hypothetical protein